MVNWINLCAAIAKNNERGFHVPAIRAEEGAVELFKLPEMARMVLSKPTPIVLKDDDEDEELPPPPPPTKSIGLVVPLAAHPVEQRVPATTTVVVPKTQVKHQDRGFRRLNFTEVSLRPARMDRSRIKWACRKGAGASGAVVLLRTTGNFVRSNSPGAGPFPIRESKSTTTK
jgi:hypothetical protein